MFKIVLKYIAIKWSAIKYQVEENVFFNKNRR